MSENSAPASSGRPELTERAAFRIKALLPCAMASKDSADGDQPRHAEAGLPAQMGGGQFEGRARLPHRGERPGVVAGQAALRAAAAGPARSARRSARTDWSRAATRSACAAGAASARASSAGGRRTTRSMRTSSANKRHEGRVVGQVQAEQAAEVLARELVVAGVVEIAEPLRPRRRGWSSTMVVLVCWLAVVGAGGVGQPERVGLGADELAGAQVFDGMLEQRAPDGQLLHVDAVQLAQLVRRRLEEGPLVALEVDRQGEGQRRQRARASARAAARSRCRRSSSSRPRPRLRRAAGAAGSGPRSSPGKTSCRLMARAGLRTSSGQRAGSKPWVFNSASVTRSSPKPRQAVWAIDSSALRMPNMLLKWSWCQLKEQTAVGLSSEITGTRISNFRRWSTWLAASILPARPKNGSLATSLVAGRPSPSSRSSPRSQPGVAPGHHVVGPAHADELAHAERLQPGRLVGGLVAKDPAEHRHQAAAVGQQAAEGRIDRVAGGRREHHVGGRQHLFPALARRAPCADSSRAAASLPKKLCTEPASCGKLSR